MGASSGDWTGKLGNFSLGFLAVFLLAAILSSPAPAFGDSLATDSWNQTSDFPTDIWTQSCVTDGGYVYCIGGLTENNTANGPTSSVYYSQVLPQGVSGWSRTTSYPIPIRAQSCVASAGFVYCVGGYTTSAISPAVYYAPLSSSGVGQWKATTSYPSAVWTHSCVASTTGIYCVGGITPSQNESSSVYYAPITSSGLGEWTPVTSYPVGVRQQSCVVHNADLYCIGGYETTSVYYAPLTSGGLGTWKMDNNNYPNSSGVNEASCVVDGGFIYCVGGYDGPSISSGVHYTAPSPTGIGKWFTVSAYPEAVWGASCVDSGGIYCIGGEEPGNKVVNTSYYLADRSATQSGSTESQTSQTTQSSQDSQTSHTSTASQTTGTAQTSSSSSSSVGVQYLPVTGVGLAIMVAVTYFGIRARSRTAGRLA